MKVLLDTNIIIHRESYKTSHIYIGQLFKWLDILKYTKCIHPITEAEIQKFGDKQAVRSLGIKMESYTVLKTQAPLGRLITELSAKMDTNDNDRLDTGLINEVLEDRVDLFITEDRKIHKKAQLLGIADRVFTISKFVEVEVAAHPELANYKVLSVQKSYFGNINLDDPFFDSFRDDYFQFNTWYKKKSDEIAYVCFSGNKVVGFLYVKVETVNETFTDIVPVFTRKKRLKIGTMKVALNGYRIGERFLKIIFDNALINKVDEIYVTVFEHTPEKLRLIEMFIEWGFVEFGIKETATGNEKVFVRSFDSKANRLNPKITFPFISNQSSFFIVPIYPDYHTELLPDSILNTESPALFKENEPHRNALSKVYISHSYERALKPGDGIIFYRTGGKYKGVVTTIGIVQAIHNPIESEQDLFSLCRKKTFFNEAELLEFWNRYPKLKPFVVEFLYCYSLKKRINLDRLIQLGIISDVQSVPRGFSKLSLEKVFLILKESVSDESIIVD